MQTHDVRVRWAPGHTGIEGNEAADKLADLGAMKEDWDTGLASEPTVSGIRSIFRALRRDVQCSWWAKCSTKLSTWYKRWGLDYRVKPLPELDLPRLNTTPPSSTPLVTRRLCLVPQEVCARRR